MTAFQRKRMSRARTSRRWLQVLPAAALGLLWFAPSTAEAAILKRVHSGVTAVNSTTGVNIALELPDPSKAFVVCSPRTNNTAAQHRVTCVLSTNNLLIDGGTQIVTTAMSVSWYVAEFESGVSVQRGTVSFAFNGFTPSTAPTITAVDCSKSFVVMAGEKSDASSVASSADETLTTRAILGTVASPCGVTPGTTTTTLSIARNDGVLGGLTVAWQIVTMDGATVVSRGAPTITQANTSFTGAGALAGGTFSPAVDPGKALVLMSRAAGSAVTGAEAEYQTRADLVCGGSPVACNQVTFVRSALNNTVNHHVDIAYEVVRLDDGSSVQRGSITAGNSLTMTAAIAAVDRSAAVPFFSVSGGSSTTNTYLDETSWTAAFPVTNGTPTSDPTQLQFTRGTSISQGGHTANWFVVSFYKCQNSRLCSMSVRDGGSGSVTVSWSPIYDAGPGTTGPACLTGASTPHACDALVVRDTASITWIPSWNSSYTVSPSTPPAGGPASMRVVFNGPGQSFTDTGLSTAGTQYFYRVYPKQPGALTYITDTTMTRPVFPMNQVSVTPSANANLAWSYSTTGGSTLNAPIAGSGKVYVASNGNKVIALNSSTGAELATPVSTNGAVQSYLAWFPVSAGSGNEAVIAADDKGWLTRVDALTGARQWTTQLPVDNVGSATQGSIYATVSAQLGAYATCDSDAFKNQYGATTDLIYVASRNNSQTANQIWAVRADTGVPQWTYPPTAGTPAMDRATGQPYVDYCTNRLWVSTGNGSLPTQDSLWVINTLNGAKVTSFPGTGVSSVGNQTGSAPTLSYSGTTVYVGDAAGKVYAFDAATTGTSAKYSLQLTGSNPQVTGYIWEDWGTPGRLYIPVVVNGSAGIWCVEDTGSALQACQNPIWTTNPRSPVASGTLAQPLVTGTAIFFPASDGKIYQINTTDGQLYLGTGRPFTVESGIALGGLSSEDSTQLYVGTSSGRSYRINLTGGNLP